MQSAGAQQTPILTRIKDFWNSIGIYTKITFILCVIMFIVEFFTDDPVVYAGFNAFKIVECFEVWRLFTYAYLHGSILHIFFNMVALISLGSMLEKRQGTFHFMISSIQCLLLSSIIHCAITFILFRGFGFLRSWYLQSGVGYSGVLFAYLVLTIRYYPEARRVCGFAIAPHLMPWLLLLVCQLIMWNVSFLGHLTGIFAGYIFFFLLKWPVYRKIIFKLEKTLVPNILRRIGGFKDMEDDGIDAVEGTSRFQSSSSQQSSGSIFTLIRNRIDSWRNSRRNDSPSDDSPVQRTSSNRTYNQLQEEQDDQELEDMEKGRPSAPPAYFPGEGRRLGDGDE